MTAHPPQNSSSGLGSESGFSLIELVLSITIIAICLTGTMLALRHATSINGDPMLRAQAAAIAEAYMDEIQLKDFYDPNHVQQAAPAPVAAGLDPCTPAGPPETRVTFDNVCDYNGLGPETPTDAEGNTFPDLTNAGYTVQAAVTPIVNAAAWAAEGLPGTDDDAMRIDVTIVNPRMRPNQFVLTGYRFRFQ